MPRHNRRGDAVAIETVVFAAAVVGGLLFTRVSLYAVMPGIVIAILGLVGLIHAISVAVGYVAAPRMLQRDRDDDEPRRR